MKSDFETQFIRSRDGLELAVKKYGWENEDPHPIVCLASLKRNSNDFHELALYLASEQGGSRRIVAIDARGRGLSEFDRDPSNYNLTTDTQDVLAITTALNIGEFDVIGTSHGGLIAMMLSSIRPGALRSVVLNDIGPVIDARGVVRLKKSAEFYKSAKTQDQADRMVVEFGKTYFPALAEDDWLRETSRIFTEKNGKLVQAYDPKLLNGIRGLNLDVRLPDMWQEFAGLLAIPVFCIRGALSDMLAPETLEHMEALHQNMKSLTVEGQAHAPRLETAGLPEIISAFLNRK